MLALLDTCTFLWLALEPDCISSVAADVINDPDTLLALSHVSVLEITLKHRAGKLPLPAKPESWIPSRRTFFKLDNWELTEDIIYSAGRLPDPHKDPFDRLIAAHAIERSAVILSADQPLGDLGATRIW